MFSCCLPVSRGRCLQRGSEESVFSRGRRWIRTRTQRKGRLWPFSRRRRSESSTRAKERPKQVKEEPQLVHEDPRPTPSREGPVSHTTEGQRRPAVRVAAWGSGEPGPMGAGRRTPPPEPHRPHQPPTSKPLSPNRPMALFISGLQCCACGNRTRPEDLEPKEAEPKAPAQGADTAPPVTSKVHPEELEAELEACAPPEPVPPPAASPAAAVEPGPAPDTTEAPPALEEESCPGPLLVPASEEELPVEEPKSEFSLLIFNFSRDNLIHISSDKHAYNQQTWFSDKVIHSNMTEMRNVSHQNKTKL
ncbi:skin secretory protein xP2-like [Eptesicus fuscus]|uniref:skin secretory protein xP2-like n=1 Tax=Eptesicus fuscus TaxID=29078 RepID=UPI0024046F74|nr:skin secretory protein xP2-like [Eptesicus fuscus]